MFTVAPVVAAAPRPKSATVEAVKPPTVYDVTMLRPSAALRLTPEPVSVAVTPVAADCALIAATAVARFCDNAPAPVTPASVMATPLTVNVALPEALELAVDVPAATDVAFAVAERPATLPVLMA